MVNVSRELLLAGGGDFQVLLRRVANHNGATRRFVAEDAAADRARFFAMKTIIIALAVVSAYAACDFGSIFRFGSCARN